MSVNWDVDEMEAEWKKLVGSKMLKTYRLPAMPLGGERVFLLLYIGLGSRAPMSVVCN